MRIVVNALLLAGGSVLLARRAPHRRAYPDLWSFPGGHVEPGETLEAALIREAREEIGVTPLTHHPVARIPDPDATSDPATYHLFAVTAWRGSPTLLGDEHTDLRWFPLPEAAARPDLALDAYRPLLRSLYAASPIPYPGHDPRP